MWKYYEFGLHLFLSVLAIALGVLLVMCDLDAYYPSYLVTPIYMVLGFCYGVILAQLVKEYKGLKK